MWSSRKRPVDATGGRRWSLAISGILPLSHGHARYVYDHASWQRPRSASSARPGFTGAELLRLCASHPDARGGAWRRATPRPAPRWRRSTRAWPPPTPTSCSRRTTRPTSAGSTSSSAPCPTAARRRWSPRSWARCRHIVDLSADFRLKDPDALPAVVRRGAPPSGAAGRGGLRPARVLPRPRSATPASWPRPAATSPPPPWPCAPSCRAGIIEASGVIVDAASGVSGAGRSLKPETAFCTVDEDITAYGLLTHRHTPEIEQVDRRAGAVHPPPRPDEPRHPRHLLRPAGPADHHRRGAGGAAGRLRATSHSWS